MTHIVNKYSNTTPEDIIAMFNSRSGIRELRQGLSRTERGKEIYENLKNQKVRSILRENQIEREFTGDDLYRTLNKEENYELLCELVDEEKTETARKEAKHLGKRAMMLKKLRGIILAVALYIGPTLAMIISWSINHSVFWAIAHGLLGWFYVLYFMVH